MRRRSRGFSLRLILALLIPYLCTSCDFYPAFVDNQESATASVDPFQRADTLVTDVSLDPRAGEEILLELAQDTSVRVSSLDLHVRINASTTTTLPIDANSPLLSIPLLQGADPVIPTQIALMYQVVDSNASKRTTGARLLGVVTPVSRTTQSLAAGASVNVEFPVFAGDSVHIAYTASTRVAATLTETVTEGTQNLITTIWTSAQWDKNAFRVSRDAVFNYRVANAGTQNGAFADTVKVVRVLAQ